ncbi:MAG: hypothetical protein AYK18_16730 [Theionarchaea archaeon DG-70]|nr:MAG: hypothetical protein AYK18_16730 [Theionarchaea archaeon DG-70]
MKSDNTKNQVSKPSEKALIEVLKENRSHLRHIENGRLQFTYVYSILITAVLTLLGSRGAIAFQVTRPYSTSIVGFIVLLSFLGYLLTLRANYVLHRHLEKIKKTMDDLNLTDYMARPPEGRIWKIIKARHIFEMLYTAMVIAWLAVFLYLILGNGNFIIPLWAVLTIILTIILIVFRLQLRSASLKCQAS